MDRALGDAAAAAGLANELPRIWTELQLLQEDDELWKKLDSYPYAFRGLDALFAGAITRDLVNRRRAELIDFAGAWTLAAAHLSEVTTRPYRQGARAAYSIFNRLRTLDPRDCDAALGIAFLTTADSHRNDPGATIELNRAVNACPGDPTPLWLLGRTQISQVCASCRKRDDVDSAESEARKTFARMERQFPGSAWAPAGNAELHMELARDSLNLGTEPFLSRQHYRLALQNYQQAAQITRDHALTLGTARALGGLGRTEEAINVLAGLDPDVRRHVRVHATMLQILQGARRFSEAIAEVERLPQPAMPNGLHLVGNPAGGSGAPLTIGLMESLPVSLLLGESRIYSDIDVSDFRFLPDYRAGDESLLFGPCRYAGRIRDLLLVRRPVDALRFARVGPASTDVVPGRPCFQGGLAELPQMLGYSGDLTWLLIIAAWEAGDLPQRDQLLSSLPERKRGGTATDAVSSAGDRRQNLWRFAGDLATAEATVRDWMVELPEDPIAHDRLGEIQYLRGQFAEATTSFARAIHYFTAEAVGGEVSPWRNQDRLWTTLKLGVAQERNHDGAAGYGTLVQLTNELDALRTRGSASSETEYLALSQLGHFSLVRENWRQATQHYGRAKIIEHAHLRSSSLANGVVDNNLALAHARLAQSQEAVAAARRAVQVDPASPVFTETAALAERVAGNHTEALETYDAALSRDPTLFTAHNNRGVLLAAAGRQDEAIAAFRQAVSLRPAYGVAWFNLGTALLDWHGVAGLLHGQGALGRAALADRDFRDAAGELRYDNEIYHSGLDLSRPLPTDWRFIRAADRSWSELGIVIIGSLAFRLGWNLGLDHVAGRAGGWLLRRRQPGRDSWWHQLSSRWPPAAGVLAAAIIAAVVSIRNGASPDATLLLLGAGTSVLVVATLAARTIAARAASVPITHYSWPLLSTIGLLLALIPLPLIPVPVAELPDSQAAQRVRLVAPGVLTGLAALLLISSFAFGVPLVRDLGIIAVAMLAAMALPIRPMDGGYLGRRSSEIIVAVLLAAISAALLLEWL